MTIAEEFRQFEHTILSRTLAPHKPYSFRGQEKIHGHKVPTSYSFRAEGTADEERLRLSSQHDLATLERLQWHEKVIGEEQKNELARVTERVLKRPDLDALILNSRIPGLTVRFRQSFSK